MVLSNPRFTPNLSWRTFTSGAAQLVVQLALLMMRLLRSTTWSLTPMTRVASRGSCRGRSGSRRAPAARCCSSCVRFAEYPCTLDHVVDAELLPGELCRILLRQDQEGIAVDVHGPPDELRLARVAAVDAVEAEGVEEPPSGGAMSLTATRSKCRRSLAMRGSTVRSVRNPLIAILGMLMADFSSGERPSAFQREGGQPGNCARSATVCVSLRMDRSGRAGDDPRARSFRATPRSEYPAMSNFASHALFRMLDGLLPEAILDDSDALIRNRARNACVAVVRRSDLRRRERHVPLDRPTTRPADSSTVLRPTGAAGPLAAPPSVPPFDASSSPPRGSRPRGSTRALFGLSRPTCRDDGRTFPVERRVQILVALAVVPFLAASLGGLVVGGAWTAVTRGPLRDGDRGSRVPNQAMK